MSNNTPLSEFDVTDELTRQLALPQPKVVDISQKMVLEVATGWEDPQAIAARYGYEGIAWENLRVYKPFLQAVEAQKAELEQSGAILRSKMRGMTEDVIVDLYRMAKGSDTTFGQKLAFVEMGIKLGDMAPKQTQQAGAGVGSVTILFTNANAPAPMTIDATDVTPKAVTA